LSKILPLCEGEVLLDQTVPIFKAWCGLAVMFRNKWMAANKGLKPRLGGETEGQRVLMHLLLEILPMNLWRFNKSVFFQLLS